MNNHPIATILGGGGFIGRYLVRILAKNNYRCIIPTRNPFEKGYLKTQAPPGAIELIDWNPNNFSELKEAIKNSDVVINLIGILYETRKQKFYNIHSTIPEVIAKACKESEVKKFIHVSAIGANDNSKSLYQKSKYSGEVKTIFSNESDLVAEVLNADLIIGAVLLPGAKAPKLVNKKMVSEMKPGSVIVDVAIDQGGCVETAHPTTHSDPTFVIDGVVHYCVANMPGAVPNSNNFSHQYDSSLRSHFGE